MIILVNASNMRQGGGLQVSDSILRSLKNFTEHRFIVVYPKELSFKSEYNAANVVSFEYNGRMSIKLKLFGRDSFLDRLVKEYKVEVVFSIFGPTSWIPRVKHICGFARAQLLIPESANRNDIKWTNLGTPVVFRIVIIRIIREEFNITAIPISFIILVTLCTT